MFILKSENVLKVIKKFESISHLDTPLDMGESSVNYRNACGTPHCHGGWYAIASYPKPNRKFFGIIRPEWKTGGLTFGAGITSMMEDLGIGANLFEVLVEYLNRNPYIWGNHNYRIMFSNPSAFYNREKRPNGAKSLRDIINHWQEVYERVLATENLPVITNPPITAEMLIEEIAIEQSSKIQSYESSREC